MSKQTIPVADDATANPAQLLDRAATDYAVAQAAARTRAEQGGPGRRQGVLPGGEN